MKKLLGQICGSIGLALLPATSVYAVVTGDIRPLALYGVVLFISAITAVLTVMFILLWEL